jgi:hypothetical protein
MSTSPDNLEQLEQLERPSHSNSIYPAGFSSAVSSPQTRAQRKVGKRDAFAMTLLIGAFVLLAAEVVVGYAVSQTGSSASQLTKLFWDWTQLLILPLFLAAGGLFYYLRKRNLIERQRTRDAQCETVLQTYIDRLTEFLTSGAVNEESGTDPVVRARTGVALRLLDTRRKGLLIRFLNESTLLEQALGNNLAGVDLQDTDLSQLALRRVNFQGANLRQADFMGSDLSQANLSQADLGGASLRGANLSEADLSGVLLDRADLRNANLSSANLSGAVLDGANLCGAKLDGAELDGATFLKSIITAEQLDSARSDIGIITS